MEKDAGEFIAQGVPEHLKNHMVATGLYQFSLLDVIDISDILARRAAEVADTCYALMVRLGADGLLAISQLPRDDRWHSLAQLAIRAMTSTGRAAL